jgi:hypothetical protein
MFDRLSSAERKLPGRREAPVRVLGFVFAKGKRKNEFGRYFFVTL